MKFGKALKIHIICREKSLHLSRLSDQLSRKNCVMAPKNCKPCYEIISQFNLEMKIGSREMVKKRNI